MPFALALIGAALIVTAIRGTQAQLGTQIAGDFKGSGSGSSFLVWLAAIIIVGALGYSPTFRTPSRLLLALILLGMFIANKGFFAQFTAAIKAPASAETPTTATGAQPAVPAAIPVQLTGGQGSPGGSGSTADTALSAVKTAAQILPAFF